MFLILGFQLKFHKESKRKSKVWAHKQQLIHPIKTIKVLLMILHLIFQVKENLSFKNAWKNRILYQRSNSKKEINK